MKKIMKKTEMFGAFYEHERTFEDELIARWIAGRGYYTGLYEDLYREVFRKEYFTRIDNAETEEELALIGEEIQNKCREFSNSSFLEGVIEGIRLTTNQKHFCDIIIVIKESICDIYKAYEQVKKEHKK
jgi:hypothetical protein